MQRRLSLLASLGLVLGAAPSATAATVSAQMETFATHVALVVRVDAAAGERNQLVVTLTDAIRVADSVPLAAGAGCRKEPDGRVACDRPAPGAPYAYVDAGDEDDAVRFDIGSEVMEISVDGGDGDDLLVGGGRGTNSFAGGSGDDRMCLSATSVQMVYEPGGTACA